MNAPKLNFPKNQKIEIFINCISNGTIIQNLYIKTFLYKNVHKGRVILFFI